MKKLLIISAWVLILNILAQSALAKNKTYATNTNITLSGRVSYVLEQGAERRVKQTWKEPIFILDKPINILGGKDLDLMYRETQSGVTRVRLYSHSLGGANRWEGLHLKIYGFLKRLSASDEIPFEFCVRNLDDQAKLDEMFSKYKTYVARSSVTLSGTITSKEFPNPQEVDKPPVPENVLVLDIPFNLMGSNYGNKEIGIETIGFTIKDDLKRKRVKISGTLWPSPDMTPLLPILIRVTQPSDIK